MPGWFYNQGDARNTLLGRHQSHESQNSILLKKSDVSSNYLFILLWLHQMDNCTNYNQSLMTPPRK